MSAISNDLTAQSANLLFAQTSAGTLKAEQIARAHLERIAAREPEVMAWAHVDPDLALASAAELDKAQARGPLHGVPIGIKDVLLTRDMPTRHNSAAHEDAKPTLDASAVAILRAAGALIIGKTTTVEFASTGRRAKTRNPLDLTRSPGGSSSGSAAAVADRQVPLAIGTQTGGSMMRPASFCGVFAMKPTWGVVSAEGAKVSSPTLDTIGWFAREGVDLKLLYDVFDTEAKASPPLNLRGARIAICRSPVWGQAEAGTRQAMETAETRLRDAGVDLSTLDLPTSFEDLPHHHKVVMESECRASFLAERRTNGETLHPSIRAYVENAAGHTRGDLRRAYDMAAEGRKRFDDLSQNFDAVVTPSSVGEAHVGPQEIGIMVFNAIWTLLHVPCVNVPGLVGPSGMPVGLTLTGPRFSDRKVLAAAEAIAPVFRSA